MVLHYFLKVDCDSMNRKIKIGISLLLVLILINIAIGGALLLLVQDIKAPQIDVQFDLKQLTTEELKFTTVIIMTNYNSFDLSIKNLEIIGKTPDGDTIIDLHLISGTIAAKHQNTFSTNDSISFTGDFSLKNF
jgi:hypothetical protein